MKYFHKSDPFSRSLNRREFLCAVGAAGACLFAVGAQPVASVAAPSLPDNPYSFSALSQRVGSSFILLTPQGNLQAILETVLEENSNKKLQQFKAIFRINSDKESELNQDVYCLDHETLGRISLLLLPYENGSYRCMSASFCHLNV